MIRSRRRFMLAGCTRLSVNDPAGRIGFRTMALLSGLMLLESIAGISAMAEDSRNAEATDDRSDSATHYETRVRPVLHERCIACHGALKQEAELRLDTGDAAVTGGSSGAAIVPGNPGASLLLQRISTRDEDIRMPPEGEPLTPEQVDSFRQWIRSGAVSPADEVPESDPRDHWAFQSPVRPPVPAVQTSTLLRNEIDSFVAARHEAEGLTAQPEADRRTWLRRVTIDLTGLTPTLDEQNAFLADTSPDAWEKVVDRLLNSPQYGERWGRHWMDIWRYSDWWGLGAEVRNSQKHIWHWRDWIIESVNDDKPYDQMLREMLAADELYPEDLSRLRATGFLARQYFKFNRTSWLDETLEHSAKAMLGLTINCAKCHDHKYDPVSQTAYYQLRAIFEPYQVRTDLIGDELDVEKNGIPRAFDCNPDAPTYVHIRGDDRNPDLAHPLQPAVPDFLVPDAFRVEPIRLPAESHHPGLRPHVVAAYLKDADQKLTLAQTSLNAARKVYRDVLESAQAAAESGEQKDELPVVLSEDNFAQENRELWTFIGNAWKYADGTLRQEASGAQRSAIRLKALPPDDFEATLRYTPQGGDMWKSVGIRFDVSDTDGNDVMVYLSSYAGGPKAQVSYTRNGATQYPANGAQARQVALNETHVLNIRVRGALINVIADGQLAVSYRLPDQRRPGFLELITFDAITEFHAFRLQTLPASVAMQEPVDSDSKSAPTPELAAMMVNLSELSVARAEAERASIVARVAADRARFDGRDQAQRHELALTAAAAELTARLANHAEALSRAELELAHAVPEKRPEVEKKVEAARTALAQAKKQSDAVSDQYTSLTGSVKTPENNLETEESRRKPFPEQSSGRRTAFAVWLTDARNPLTARVAVNHLWARHFGRGLVPTVFDFGRKGTPPSHPELLDWLAVEFMENGWSMKHLHRIICLSGTYRLTSSATDAHPQTLARDRDNKWLWRRNPVRMEAQVVRDSLLSLAGELDLTIGGPTVPVNNDQSRRRSLYYFHSHNEHQKFLSMFDDANVLECYRRAESIVPQQALALENSPLASEMASGISERLTQKFPEADDEDFIRRAFVEILCTEPSDEEVEISHQAMEKLVRAASGIKSDDSPIPPSADLRTPDAVKRARSNFVRALLNHNDFVTVR